MPGFIAKKLCPDLIIVPAHFSKYRASSDLVREVLARYDPQFSPVGLDESYLDLTEFVRQRIERQQPQQNVGEVGSLLCIYSVSCSIYDPGIRANFPPHSMLWLGHCLVSTGSVRRRWWRR